MFYLAYAFDSSYTRPITCCFPFQTRENVFVKNKEVSVCVGSSDQWLCLAKLPLDYTDKEFQVGDAHTSRTYRVFLRKSAKLHLQFFYTNPPSCIYSLPTQIRQVDPINVSALFYILFQAFTICYFTITIT